MTTPGEHIMITRSGHSFRRGFTLAELVASMAIMTILMTGMGSAIMIASNAMPDGRSPMEITAQSKQVVEDIAGDLLYATSITAKSADSITFIVADRNHGDPGPETINYSWSGTPGDSLTRQYNGGTVTTVMDNVQDFTLTYTNRTETVTDQVIETSAETVIVSFDDSTAPGGAPQNFGLDLNTWIASFFVADVPNGTGEMQITRGIAKMRQGAHAGSAAVTVAIHRSKGGGNPEPRLDPLGVPVTLPSGSLPSPPTYQWMPFEFTDLTMKNPGKEYVLVIKGTSSDGLQADGDVLRLYDTSFPKDDVIPVWTFDGGGIWNPKKNQQADYRVSFFLWGTYSTTTTQTRETDILVAVGVALRADADTSTRVETEVQILNTPETTGS